MSIPPHLPIGGIEPELTKVTLILRHYYLKMAWKVSDKSKLDHFQMFIHVGALYTVHVKTKWL